MLLNLRVSLALARSARIKLARAFCVLHTLNLCDFKLAFLLAPNFVKF